MSLSSLLEGYFFLPHSSALISASLCADSVQHVLKPQVSFTLTGFESGSFTATWRMGSGQGGSSPACPPSPHPKSPYGDTSVTNYTQPQGEGSSELCPPGSGKNNMMFTADGLGEVACKREETKEVCMCMGGLAGGGAGGETPTGHEMVNGTDVVEAIIPILPLALELCSTQPYLCHGLLIRAARLLLLCCLYKIRCSPMSP
jgi:hypothetical protein